MLNEIQFVPEGTEIDVTELQDLWCYWMVELGGERRSGPMAAKLAGYAPGSPEAQRSMGYKNWDKPHLRQRMYELAIEDEVTLWQLGAASDRETLKNSTDDHLKHKIASAARDRIRGSVETHSSSHSVIEGNVAFTDVIKSINEEKQALDAERAGVVDADYEDVTD